MSKKYVEQYERVKRWHQRLKNITYGKEHNPPSEYDQDEILMIFCPY